MNRKEAKELLPIIQAFAEGKPIQYRYKCNKTAKWEDVEKESHEFAPEFFMYRVTPALKYRPFKNVDECWQEMQKHQPFGWIKDHSSFSYIIYLEDEMIGYGRVSGTILHDNFKDVLRCYTFADGTPFGVKKG